MFKVGNLTPATCQSFGSSPAVVYPDLYKFYFTYPTSSNQSSAGNQRRPHLWTSLNGGRTLTDETTGNQGFYWANYGGNLYFNSDKYHLEAWGHKSISSSYGSYSASCGNTETKTGIKLGYHGWSTSSVIPYNTGNLPEKLINLSNTNNRYFSVSSSFLYNTSPWSTKNWTITKFGESTSSLYTCASSYSFKCFAFNSEKKNEALIIFSYTSYNYIKICLVDLANLTTLRDFTSDISSATLNITTTGQYMSVDFIPGIGYILMYQNSSQTSQGFQTKLIYTHNPTTGADYNYSQYSVQSARTVGSSSNRFYSVNGAHSWYCPWSKEFYIVPNASQVFWTKDGINWNASGTTGKSGACTKFLTDGNTYMILAYSANQYKWSKDKGQTWATGSSLTPNAFYATQSNDSIILPFKCVNNLITSNVTYVPGYRFNTSTGEPQANSWNFYIDDYFPVTAGTSYVTYGKNKSTGVNSYWNRIDWYDSNKTWISEQEGVTQETPAVFTAPSNAAYARVCFNIFGAALTQSDINNYNWYFAKEDDFQVMTEYGDISCN